MVQKDVLFWNLWKHSFTIFNFTDMINLIFFILFWWIFFFLKKFVNSFFFIFIESSETHLELVTSKIGAKLNYLWWYCGKFSMNFEYEIDHFSKKFKSQDCFFIGSWEHCASFWTDNPIWPILSEATRLWGLQVVNYRKLYLF